VRFVLELAVEVRAVMLFSMPLLTHIPSADWKSHDPSVPAWDIEQCVGLAKALSNPKLGVDLLDVTSAGLMAEQKIVSKPGYQAPFEQAVKKAVVGLIKQRVQAEKLLQNGAADVVLTGKAFQKNSGLVWQ
jgi:2,4-dienoyl-CoA reductase-like NADH-dependent reductase (Old Yellow Enzyme family)